MNFLLFLCIAAFYEEEEEEEEGVYEE